MKISLSPFTIDNKGVTLFDNSNKLARIIYKRHIYLKMILGMIRKKIPLVDIGRNMFPSLSLTPLAPTALNIELSSICNIKCTYCPNPLNLRPKGFMNCQTFDALNESIRGLAIDRAHICGNGESTLHPDFPSFVSVLAKNIKYLSVVTNGQWDNIDIPFALLEAPADLVEFSVDGCDKETYEKSRVGSSFELLIKNLSFLKKNKRPLPLVHARVMVRPSDAPHKNAILSFWKQYADVVSPNPVSKLDRVDDDKDVYPELQFERNLFPDHCAKLFRIIAVFWDGRVPLCGSLEHRTWVPNPILGNVNTNSLGELWGHPLMKQYRQGHRNRNYEQIPCCIGCGGN